MEFNEGYLLSFQCLAPLDVLTVVANHTVALVAEGWLFLRLHFFFIVYGVGIYKYICNKFEAKEKKNVEVRGGKRKQCVILIIYINIK